MYIYEYHILSFNVYVYLYMYSSLSSLLNYLIKRILNKICTKHISLGQIIKYKNIVNRKCIIITIQSWKHICMLTYLIPNPDTFRKITSMGIVVIILILFEYCISALENKTLIST